MTDTATETAVYSLGTVGMLCTRDGLDVLAQGLADEAQIKFTRVAIGDGVMTAESEDNYREQVLNLKAILNWRLDIPIAEIINQGDGQVLLNAIRDNAEVAEGFFAREQAIYAINPATGKEILYSYRNCGDKASYIPSNTGPVTKMINLGLLTVIQNCKNVTAVIDHSFAYVSRADYLEHLNSEHPHKNSPTHYLDVYDTKKLWATDEDNHLHQISVGNAREVILGDAAKLYPKLGKVISDNQSKINELQILTQAKNELGLDANVLLVENFDPQTVVDEFKCKVLSCARGGRLIGVVSDDGIYAGAYYCIADGVNQELVQIKGIAYSTDYYRVTLTKALTYDYNLDTVNLYRSTITAGVKTVDKKSHTWKTEESFKGIEANLERKIYLDTSLKNSAAFKITGAGLLTSDGYFTLKKDFSGSYSYSEGEFPEPSTVPGGGGDYDDVEEFITFDDIEKLFDGD